MRRITATDSMPDFTGLSLDHGRYRLLENIGRGAYGKVYRATEVSHRTSKKQILAIKCLRKSTDPSRPSYLSQKRELEYHKLVSGHPNIVTFHRHFSDGDFVYVVLDLCSGGDLFSAIKKGLFHRNNSLIKSVYVQLIDALAHCHRLGVFHRDIKPENILCSDNGSVIRLTDFGLSIMSLYSQDFRCGSSEYMSPECIGNQVCHREYATSYNDIWALGVILTNLITARNPWKYASMGDDRFAAYLMDNNFLKQSLPISEGVNDILKDIFIVNPARRLTLAKMRSKVLALDALWGEPSPSDTLNGHHALTFKAGSPELQSNIVPIHLDQTDPSSVFTEPFRSAGCLSVPVSDSSGSSSAPESGGPITPTTHALDVGPVVDIPGISSEVLGDPTDLQRSSVVYKHRDVMASAKTRRPASIFQAAVRRLRNWYKADPVA